MPIISSIAESVIFTQWVKSYLFADLCIIYLFADLCIIRQKKPSLCMFFAVFASFAAKHIIQLPNLG